MYQLVYSSITNKNFDKQSIANLLLSSQAFNLEHGVTGCILFNGKEIIQILEGEEKDVKGLYGKIAIDARHKHITELYQQPVPGRCFDQNFITSETLATELAGNANILTFDEMKAKLTCETVAVKLFGKLIKIMTSNN